MTDVAAKPRKRLRPKTDVLGDLTLTQLEQLAIRCEGAAKSIRESLSLLGGVAPAAQAKPGPPGIARSEATPIQPNVMTPERQEYVNERQQRQQEELALLRKDPLRQSLLAQFAHDEDVVPEEEMT